MWRSERRLTQTEPKAATKAMSEWKSFNSYKIDKYFELLVKINKLSVFMKSKPKWKKSNQRKIRK